MEDSSSSNQYPHVLIIDDDFCHRRLLERFILRYGGRCDSASDGESGLKKAMSDDYDLAFVDIQLPKLDGFMVTTLLRESGCKMPLIAITSLQIEDLESKAYAIGFDNFLTKPISENEVIKQLKASYLLEHTS